MSRLDKFHAKKRARVNNYSRCQALRKDLAQCNGHRSGIGKLCSIHRLKGVLYGTVSEDDGDETSETSEISDESEISETKEISEDNQLLGTHV